MVVLAVTMVVAALAPPLAEAAISCDTVMNDLSSCINYVMYGRAAPSANCCSGMRSLYKAAAATADRQAICNCLQSVAGQATPTIVNTSAALPGKCGVSSPYKISPSTDCSKVQ